MNCILYNDHAVSQKYHNNGTLELITSFIISIFSNVLTSIVIYFINRLINYHQYIEIIIKEIKNIYQYFIIILKLFKNIYYKYIILFIFEIWFGLFMIYYLFIFSTIFSKTIGSFLMNYVLSLINSVLYSIVLTFIISFLRRISVAFRIKKLYIISVYINEHF